MEREPTTRPAGPQPPSGQGTGRSLFAGILLVLAAFAVTHGPHVLHNLPKRHWEDGRHFHHNREQIHSLADCFTKPTAWAGGAEATYRPLSANLYYFAGRTLFAVLLLLLCRELLPWPSSLLPPILFVSRMAHEQDIAYTSNFDTLSYAAFGLALLCKEAAIVWPAILLAYGWLFDRAEAWRRYVAAWVLAAGWVVAYRHVIDRIYPAGTPGFTLDLHPLALLGRYGAYLLSFVNRFVPNVDPEHAGWAVPPGIAAIATGPAVLWLTAYLASLTALLMAWSRVRPASMGRPARVVAFGLGWFVVGTAPYAVLAHRLFMRYSYVGHAGLAVALGGLTAGAGEPAWAGIRHALRRSAPAEGIASGRPPGAYW